MNFTLLIGLGLLSFWVSVGCSDSGGSGVEPSRVTRGEGLYAEYCQSCHGRIQEGERSSLAAPSHGAEGHTWHHADGQLAAIILGQFTYPGRTMPTFEGTLTEAQVAAILTYLKTGWTEEQLEYQAEVSRNWEQLQQNLR